MRIRKKKWAEPELSACDFYIAEPKAYKNRWKSFFKNDNPIMLEVGCGRQMLRVRGEDLRIRCMDREELLVDGTILAVEVENA